MSEKLIRFPAAIVCLSEKLFHGKVGGEWVSWPWKAMLKGLSVYSEKKEEGKEDVTRTPRIGPSCEFG